MFLEGLFTLLLFICICKLYLDARLDDWNVMDDEDAQKRGNT